MSLIYISSHSAEEANALAAKLTEADHVIASTWHTETGPRPDLSDALAWARKAKRNQEQIRNAEVLVLIAGPDKYAGGKFYEAGYAHGVGTGVIVLGRVENGMLHSNSVGKASTVEELLSDLEE